MLLVDVTILDIRVYCTRNLFSNVFVTWKCNVDSIRINSSLVEQKYSFYSQQLLESDCSNTKTERFVLNPFCFWFFFQSMISPSVLIKLGKRLKNSFISFLIIKIFVSFIFDIWINKTYNIFLCIENDTLRYDIVSLSD